MTIQQETSKTFLQNLTHTTSDTIIIPTRGLIHPDDEPTINTDSELGILPVLISNKHLKPRILHLAEEIIRDADKTNQNLIRMIIIMRGAEVFAKELTAAMRSLRKTEIQIDHITISSYGYGTTSSGEPEITGSPLDVEDKPLIVVEDIVDTGRTVAALKNLLLNNGKAASVKICSLLNKPSRRLPEFKIISKPDYTGFIIPDVFVVGFGMDHEEKFRDLPCVARIQT